MIDRALIVFIAWLGFVFVGLPYLRVARGRSALLRWTQERGVTLQEAKLAWWDRGPFSGSLWARGTHLRIKVLDAEGETRNGWARARSGFLGILGLDVDVVWSDRLPAPPPGRPRPRSD